MEGLSYLGQILPMEWLDQPMASGPSVGPLENTMNRSLHNPCQQEIPALHITHPRFQSDQHRFHAHTVVAAQDSVCLLTIQKDDHC